MGPQKIRTLINIFENEVEKEVEPLIAVDLAPDPLTYAPAHELGFRRATIACLDEILRKERLRHGKKKQEFQVRWAAAAKTFHEIDTTLSSLDRPYIETKMERDRAIFHTVKLKELQAQKKHLTVGLLKEKCLLREVKSEIRERILKFIPVKAYLTDVVQASNGEYKVIQQLIDRADLLLGTRENLIARSQEVEELIEKRENDNSILATENSRILLNNYIGEIEDELAEGKEIVRRLESELSHVKDTAHQRTMQIGEMKVGTYSLYSNVCDTLGTKAQIESRDFMAQLEFVKWTLIEINHVRATLTELLNKQKAWKEREAEQKRKMAKGRWISFVRKDKGIDLNRRAFALDPERPPEVDLAAKILGHRVKKKMSDFTTVVKAAIAQKNTSHAPPPPHVKRLSL